MFRKIIVLTQAAILGLAVFLPASALARDASCYKTFLGIQPWFQYLDVSRENGECRIDWDSTAESNVQRVSVAIVDILISVAGVAAFLFLVLSGFRFVLSQGDPGKEKAARAAAQNAVIGLVIAILSTAILRFLTRSLTS